MFKIFGESKLLTATKYIALLAALLFMGVLAFIIVKKNDPKIPQKEVVIHLKIDDQLNICLPVNE